MSVIEDEYKEQINKYIIVEEFFIFPRVEIENVFKLRSV